MLGLVRREQIAPTQNKIALRGERQFAPSLDFGPISERSVGIAAARLCRIGAWEQTNRGGAIFAQAFQPIGALQRRAWPRDDAARLPALHPRRQLQKPF